MKAKEPGDNTPGSKLKHKTCLAIFLMFSFFEIFKKLNCYLSLFMQFVEELSNETKQESTICVVLVFNLGTEIKQNSKTRTNYHEGLVFYFQGSRVLGLICTHLY